YLQWRISSRAANDAPADQRQKLKKLIIPLLKQIDDDVILAQKSIFPEHKLYALSLKYERNTVKELRYDQDGYLYFDQHKVFNTKRQTVRLEFISVTGQDVTLEGWYGGFNTKNQKAYVEVDGGKTYEFK